MNEVMLRDVWRVRRWLDDNYSLASKARLSDAWYEYVMERMERELRLTRGTLKACLCAIRDSE